MTLLQARQLEQMQETKRGLTAISVIVPVYNEEHVIGELIHRIHRVMETCSYEYEIIVVDDGSTDTSYQVAEQGGATLLRHPYNKGNGAAVKTGIRHAQGDVLVLLDGDGQHDPCDIPRLLDPIGEYDLVVGARTRDSHQAWHRRLANAVYNLFASYITGVRILDLTSGFRAVRTDLARKCLYLLPNTFSYPTTMTIAFMKAGYSVAFVPITSSPRVAGDSKIHLLSDGTHFFIILFKVATLFSPLKVFLPLSLAFLMSGAAYGAHQLILFHKFRNMATVLLIFGISLFVLGLISEQIAQLRFQHTE